MADHPLADYLKSEARWREHKAIDWPDDPRNGRSAESLHSLAAYVESEADARQPGIVAEIEAFMSSGTFADQDAEHRISRYGFGGHRPIENPAMHAAFLRELLSLLSAGSDAPTAAAA